MRLATSIIRTLFGLAFMVFGLNGVLSAFGMDFMKPPEDMPAAAAAFFGAMAETHYMLPLIGATELLSGCLAPLGLTLLAPVVVNIVLYHHFVDPSGLVIAYVVLVLEVFLAYAYGPAFRGLLTPCARSRWSGPRAGSAE